MFQEDALVDINQSSEYSTCTSGYSEGSHTGLCIISCYKSSSMISGLLSNEFYTKGRRWICPQIDPS